LQLSANYPLNILKLVHSRSERISLKLDLKRGLTASLSVPFETVLTLMFYRSFRI